MGGDSMIKNNKFVAWLGAFAFVAGVQLATPETSQAGVAVGDDGKLVLSGYVRFRTEYDDRSNTPPNADQDRLRVRLRARFGGVYTVDENWSGGFRLATSSHSNNSTHQTFGLLSAGDNANFGIDRAYIKYQRDGFSIWGGKNGINFWEQTEVFWDGDIQPEGLAATYKYDPVTVNLGYFWVTNGNWQGQPGATDDLKLATYQIVGSHELDVAGGIKLTAAIGGATLFDDVETPPAADQFNSDSGWTVGLQAKGGDWLLGGEYFGGDATTEDAGFTIQGRYKAPVGNGIDLRVYYYDIEANALVADGLFTQDNFPSANANATNFQGWRFQAGYKIVDHVSADVRWYTMEAKTTVPAVPSRPAGSLFANNVMSRADWDRWQLNVNVKF
jgi:hypothetical protein